MSSSAFWSSAAALSGRVDLRPVLPVLRSGGTPSVESLHRAGVSPKHIPRLLAARAPALPQPHLTLADPAYPPLLAAIDHPPPVLFLRGNAALLQAPCVAVVGSRRCTGRGRRLAAMLARAVARAGGVVVSGLAYGIDEAAHDACPDRTIAVLGQGLARPLTARQERLADRIQSAGGLVLSEYPPDTPATRYTFPQRNRVIAGLGRGTIVVEAGRRSGALITARLALAAGRDVLAVPGCPLDEASQGCLDLIADGAGLARGRADVLTLLPDAAASAATRPDQPQLPPGFEAALRRGATLDDLAGQLQLPLPQLGATVAALELTGMVERLPGDRFALREPD